MSVDKNHMYMRQKSSSVTELEMSADQKLPIRKVGGKLYDECSSGHSSPNTLPAKCLDNRSDYCADYSFLQWTSGSIEYSFFTLEWSGANSGEDLAQ